ncbi:MAG: hypothetical protein WHS77_07210 [Brevinematales bacterium]
MKKFILFILVLIVSCSSGGSKKELSINDIFGDWVTISGYDASEISFGVDENTGMPNFYSFLQGRPYESGECKISGNLIIIDVGNAQYVYSNVVIKDGVLSFIADGKKATFKAGEFNQSLRKLLNYMIDFNTKSGNVFSYPEATSFKWVNEESENTILGYKMSLTIQKDGKITNSSFVYSLLNKGGFTSDLKNVTEIISGYIKDNIVCLAIEIDDPEDEKYSYLTLKFGILQ